MSHRVLSPLTRIARHYNLQHVLQEGAVEKKTKLRNPVIAKADFRKEHFKTATRLEVWLYAQAVYIFQLKARPPFYLLLKYVRINSYDNLHQHYLSA